MFENYVPCIGADNGPNRFWPIQEEEIDTAESRMDVKFPSALRNFYLNVGCGFWCKGTADADWDRSLVNGILSPNEIAELVCDEENIMRPQEGFAPSTIPFFDCGENTYLCLAPEFDQSPVYWSDGKTKVCQCLVSFFHELEVHAAFYRGLRIR